MIIALIANRESEPYIRRVVFCLPRVLSVIGVVIDVLGLLLLALIPEGETGCAVRTVGMAMGGVCLLLTLICAVWVLRNFLVKKRWSSKEGAYGVFWVQIFDRQ